MLARLGNVIYWAGCSLAIIALLVVAGIVAFLILPKADYITLTEIQPPPQPPPGFVLDKPGPWNEYRWWRVKEGEIEVERLGIIEIKGNTPNESERQEILDLLRKQHARQIKEKLERDRQESYFLVFVLAGLAGVSWLVGRTVRYILAGK